MNGERDRHWFEEGTCYYRVREQSSNGEVEPIVETWRCCGPSSRSCSAAGNGVDELTFERAVVSRARRNETEILHVGLITARMWYRTLAELTLYLYAKQCGRSQVSDLGAIALPLSIEEHDRCTLWIPSSGWESRLSGATSVVVAAEAFEEFSELSMRAGQLEVLKLTGCGVNDAMMMVPDWNRERIRLLDVGDTLVGDEDLVWLSSYSRVEELSLKGARLSEDAMRQVTNSPALRNLNCSECRWDIAQSVFEVPSTVLEQLILDRSSFGDEECVGISAWRSVQRLSCAFTSVSNRGLSEIARMPSLEYLDISGTQIGDDGILSLLQHTPQLKCLRMRSLSVSVQVYDSLLRGLPNADIIV